jgi:hypothetical protein
VPAATLPAIAKLVVFKKRRRLRIGGAGVPWPKWAFVMEILLEPVMSGSAGALISYPAGDQPPTVIGYLL